MAKQLLPNGSVVTLKGATKKLMTIGIEVEMEGDEKTYDYIAIPYPEGYIDSETMFLFMQEDIENVSFVGFVDAEMQVFRTALEETDENDNNEDNFWCCGDSLEAQNQGMSHIRSGYMKQSEYPLLAVFDGMGGGEYGEIASYMGAKATEEYLNAEEADDIAGKKGYLEKMCTHVNDRIFKETLRLDAEMMGSTLAGLYFTGNQVWTVNVGDSRCFLLRDGKLRQISEDQTDEAYMKENGIQGRKPYLTQYMGMNPEEVRVLPYMDCLQTKRGDRFLICSDGVSDMVPVDFLETMMQQTQSTAKCVDAILTAALDAGGKDNITAIVLEINR